MVKVTRRVECEACDCKFEFVVDYDKKLSRYEDALKFYAENNNYLSNRDQWQQPLESVIDMDKGSKAREVLGEK